MLTNKGYRCDAEIGRFNDWHNCNRKATQCIKASSGVVLHYCAKHAANRQSPRDFTPATFAIMKPINAIEI